MDHTLAHKNAVIYGAAGGLGRGVARTFAREGATVFLVGRTESKLRRLADAISEAGGRAEVAVVDALDPDAVAAHLSAVASQYGPIDLSLNLVSRGDVQGTPLLEMSTVDLLKPVVTGLTANFVTAGQYGIRVLGIWTAGVAETFASDEADTNDTRQSSGLTPEAIEAAMASMSMLKKGTHLPQVAEALAFLASDRAAGITGTMVNVTTGLFAG